MLAGDRGLVRQRWEVGRFVWRQACRRLARRDRDRPRQAEHGPQAEGPDRYPVDARFRPARGRLVAACGRRVAPAQPDARERDRPAHEGPLLRLPAHEVRPVLLRCGRGEGGCHPRRRDGAPRAEVVEQGAGDGRGRQGVGQRPGRRSDGRRRPQRPLRLDHRHAAVGGTEAPRCGSLRRHAARPRQALHRRRHVRARLLPGLRRAVGEGGGKDD